MSDLRFHEQALTTEGGAPQAHYRVLRPGSRILVDFFDADGKQQMVPFGLEASTAILAHHIKGEFDRSLCEAFDRDFLAPTAGVEELRIPAPTIQVWLDARKREREIGAAIEAARKA